MNVKIWLWESLKQAAKDGFGNKGIIYERAKLACCCCLVGKYADDV